MDYSRLTRSVSGFYRSCSEIDASLRQIRSIHSPLANHLLRSLETAVEVLTEAEHRYAILSFSINLDATKFMAKMGLTRGSKVLDNIKQPNPEQIQVQRPKHPLEALLDEDRLSDGEDEISSHDKRELVRNKESESGGHGFRVNHEFAKRFEHNKRREELHKRN